MGFAELSARYGDLLGELSRMGYVCSGTVMSLYRRCGKSGCGCNEDPQMRHGPYHIWTRKENGKTVTRSLSKEQADECIEYIENYRRMENIIEEMREISARIVQATR